jgi:hypothetical protein
MTVPFSIWVYLSTTPLLWLALTLVAWIVADTIAKWCGRHPLVNPVLIAIVLMGSILVATGTPYETYFQGAQFVHFLLGPATVAIAVPLVRHCALVRANILPMLAALSAGAVTAVVSVVAVAAVLGVPRWCPWHRNRRRPGSRWRSAKTWAARADCGSGHHHWRDGRGDRFASNERAEDPRLRRPRLRSRPGVARHRHGAGVRGRRNRRNFCRYRDGFERRRDSAGGAFSAAMFLGRKTG